MVVEDGIVGGVAILSEVGTDRASICHPVAVRLLLKMSSIVL